MQYIEDKDCSANVCACCLWLCGGPFTTPTVSSQCIPSVRTGDVLSRDAHETSSKQPSEVNPNGTRCQPVMQHAATNFERKNKGVHMDQPTNLHRHGCCSQPLLPTMCRDFIITWDLCTSRHRAVFHLFSTVIHGHATCVIAALPGLRPASAHQAASLQFTADTHNCEW